jgi:hypothetical protein
MHTPNRQPFLCRAPGDTYIRCIAQPRAGRTLNTFNSLYSLPCQKMATSVNTVQGEQQAAGVHHKIGGNFPLNTAIIAGQCRLLFPHDLSSSKHSSVNSGRVWPSDSQIANTPSRRAHALCQFIASQHVSRSRRPVDLF